MSDFLNVLKSYFKDESVNEISVNSTHSLNVFKKGKLEKLPSPFDSQSELTRKCQTFAREQCKRLDPLEPSTGSSLCNGSYRWHCVIPPASSIGPIFNLRKHRFDNTDLESFSIDKDLKKKLHTLLENRENHFLICGPTGSGKTTFLSVLLRQLSQNERLIILEDYEELPPLFPQWIRLTAKSPDIEGKGGISIPYLLEESLRLSPDRLVLGEVRNINSLSFFESMFLGHQGSMTTIHASNVSGVKDRIDFLWTLRTKNSESFFQNLTRSISLWCIFMQRGSPPSVIGIEPFR